MWIFFPFRTKIYIVPKKSRLEPYKVGAGEHAPNERKGIKNESQYPTSSNLNELRCFSGGNLPIFRVES